MKFVVLLKIN